MTITRSSLEQDYKAYCDLFVNGAEQEALNALGRFIDTHGVDARITCKDNPNIDTSPLMMACKNDHVSIVEFLLKHKPDLLQVTTAGESVLMQVQSIEVLKLILDKAKEHNCLNELMNLKDCLGRRAHDHTDLDISEKVISTDIKLLYQLANQADELNSLFVLRRLHDAMGYSHFVELIKLKLEFDMDEIKKQYTLLDRYRIRNLKRLLTECILLGVSLDDTGDKRSKKLRAACEKNKIMKAKLILSKKTNLLHVDKNGISILMAVKSKKMCALILAEAKKQKCLKHLLSLKDSYKRDAYSLACMSGKIDVLTELMRVEGYEQQIDMSRLLHNARLSYWWQPDKSEIFDKLCATLRPKVEKVTRAVTLEQDAGKLNKKIACLTLFGSSYPSSISTKEEALKAAISQLHALLASPAKCIKYLQFLNQEFLRYYQEKHGQVFPTLNPDSYDFKMIDNTYYPIPKDKHKYVKLNKSHALQEYLTALFNQYDLGKKACKWIGYIPHEIADAMVTDGDMLTESRLGSGLFHGKLAHMLQRAILIFAIQNKEIALKKISIKDIFNGLVSINEHNEKNKLWMPVRDCRVIGMVSFNDPHRLGSVIMHEGKKLGMRALSDSLIDTFCNGFLHLLDAYHDNQNFGHLDIDTIIGHMDDIETALFDIPPFLLQAAIKLEKGSIRSDALEDGTEYAIVPKHYDVYINFEPRKFRI